MDKRIQPKDRILYRKKFDYAQQKSLGDQRKHKLDNSDDELKQAQENIKKLEDEIDRYFEYLVIKDYKSTNTFFRVEYPKEKQRIEQDISSKSKEIKSLEEDIMLLIDEKDKIKLELK